MKLKQNVTEGKLKFRDIIEQVKFPQTGHRNICRQIGLYSVQKERIKTFLSILIIVLISAAFCQAAEVMKINQSKGQVFINKGKSAGFTFNSKVCFPSTLNKGMICGKVLRTTDSYSIVRIKDRRETKRIEIGSQAYIFDEKGNRIVTNPVEKILQNKVKIALNILKSNLIREEKRKQIIKIITPLFNFPLMAKLSLGKRYWPNLSDEDKQKFINLFTQRLKESYLNKISLYTDEKIIFKPPVQTKKKVKIPTELIGKNDPVNILYKFYNSKGNWLIYDVEIQGVSIISTYRSQFDQILREGTITDLLSKLKELEQ